MIFKKSLTFEKVFFPPFLIELDTPDRIRLSLNNFSIENLREGKQNISSARVVLFWNISEVSFYAFMPKF
jgi:hypothetical protein